MDRIVAMTTHDHREAFGALLQRHRGIVFKVAGSYTRQAEDRDDLAQEIAARLWHAYPKYDPARSFSTWMYRVALNVAISHLRERSTRQQHDAVPLDEFAGRRPAQLALVLGSEGDGLSARALASADTVVTIPMAGGVDSLNVASAAAVALWALR